MELSFLFTFIPLLVFQWRTFQRLNKETGSTGQHLQNVVVVVMFHQDTEYSFLSAGSGVEDQYSANVYLSHIRFRLWWDFFMRGKTLIIGWEIERSSIFPGQCWVEVNRQRKVEGFCSRCQNCYRWKYYRIFQKYQQYYKIKYMKRDHNPKPVVTIRKKLGPKKSIKVKWRAPSDFYRKD